jgi:6-phosphogluconolactonase
MMSTALALLFAMAATAFSQSEDILLIGSYSTSISRYSIDSSGSLAYLGESSVDQNPSWISLSSDHRILFAVDEIENYGGDYSGAVSSYAVNSDGSLLFLSR